MITDIDDEAFGLPVFHDASKLAVNHLPQSRLLV